MIENYFKMRKVSNGAACRALSIKKWVKNKEK
jgi:hypothetical protein